MAKDKKLIPVLLLTSAAGLYFRIFSDDKTVGKCHISGGITSLTTDMVVRNATMNMVASSAEETVRRKVKVNGNLPLDFVQRSSHRMLNDTCARLPSALDIHYNNIIWQTLTINDSKFYLYNAYYDNRIWEPHRPVVRITAIIRYNKAVPRTACQLWFTEQDTPVFSEATYDYLWQKYWNIHNVRGFLPYLVSCRIPRSHGSSIPRAVSLVEHPCDFATNALSVIHDFPENGTKEDFAVCVKATDFFFVNMKARLVEWLELLFILGATKVFYYDFGMNEETAEVMKYYEEKGQVEVFRVTLPGSQPNIPGLFFQYVRDKDRYQHEMIQYQDCYFKSIYRYKYTVHLDPDEIIVPRNVNTWKELMEVVLRKAAKNSISYASFCGGEVLYMDSMLPAAHSLEGIPLHMHILRHTVRSANFSDVGSGNKCFHDTEKLKVIHNHFPLLRINGKYPNSYDIDNNDGRLQHYRSSCQPFIKNCFERFQKHTVFDPTIWRFKEELIRRVNIVVTNLTAT